MATEWQQHGGSHGDDLIPIPVSDSPGQVTLFGTDDEASWWVPTVRKPNGQSQPLSKAGGNCLGTSSTVRDTSPRRRTSTTISGGVL